MAESRERTIANEAHCKDSIAFSFTDGSMVWVCFPTGTVIDLERARAFALKFLDEQSPEDRWDGKIDTMGRIIESRIDVGKFTP